MDARRRLVRNRAAMAGIIILALIAALALLAPLLSPFAYNEVNYDIIACAPDWWPVEAACRAPGHIFGTDSVGRDLFVRVLFGARVSLAVGLVATLVSLLIGVLYGATAGYLGGRVDNADDAHGGHALFPALRLLRHHPDGAVRPQFHPAVSWPSARWNG